MAGRSLFCWAMLFCVVVASTAQAQDADCHFFKVQSDSLNIAKEPRADAGFIDALNKNDIVCVTRDQQVGERTWGFITYAIANQNQRSIQGWAITRSLLAASPADVAAARAAPAAAAGAPAAPAAAAAGGAAPEYVVKFSEPIPFGAYPVNGHSLEELIKGVPLFPPIPGLPEALWKKTCDNCHKWNQQSLCEQATIYAKNPAMTLRQVHPYGSPEKIALMNWAKNGCQ